MWEIDDYCYKVAPSDKPVKEAPPHSLAWKAHLNSIVSIDLAEDKGLIITASTDCCVRMFTLNGRYIGVCKHACDLYYGQSDQNARLKPRLHTANRFKLIWISSELTHST